MFLLGHLGLGARMVRPWSRKLPKAAIFLGTLLPDLIDKPLYYGLSAFSGKKSAELGLVSGTRTFGHTGLLLLLLIFFALGNRSPLWQFPSWRSPRLAAVALGVATHLFLDNLADPGTVVVLFWPLLGWQFPIMPFDNLMNHLGTSMRPHIFLGEIAGAILLTIEYMEYVSKRKKT